MDELEDSNAILLAANYCRASDTFHWEERPLLNIGKGRRIVCFPPIGRESR
jgi:hypothetical protein